MFTDGFQRDIPAEILTGIVLVVLAIVVDGVLLFLGRCSRRGTGSARAGEAVT